MSEEMNIGIHARFQKLGDERRQTTSLNGHSHDRHLRHYLWSR
jgi:hypothetical protein